MKKPSIVALAAAALAFGASPAFAAYLIKQWFEGGSHFCQYDNGTVLNVGARTCPLHI